MTKILVILGNGLDIDTYNKTGIWTLPQDSKVRVKEGSDMFLAGKFDFAILSGKYSVQLRNRLYKPDTTEADLLAEEMITHGIPNELLRKEILSEDLIGNAIGVLKILEDIPSNKLSIMFPDYLEERVRGIFDMVIGNEIIYIPTQSRYTQYPDELRRQIHEQSELWKEQRHRLSNLLPQIQSGEVTLHNLYEDGAWSREGSSFTAEAALGMPSASHRLKEAS